MREEKGAKTNTKQKITNTSQDLNMERDEAYKESQKEKVDSI
jgi:hypothetical protein